MDAGTIAMVQKWLEVRKSLGVGPRKLAFGSLKGGPLRTACFRSLLPRLARKVGIEKRSNSHSLRHTFAFELAKEGVPVMAIQNALGHSNLGVTSRYLSHLAPIEQVETIHKRTWNRQCEF